MAKFSRETFEKLQDIVTSINAELEELNFAISAFEKEGGIDNEFEEIDDTDEIEELFVEVIGTAESTMDAFKNIIKDAEEVSEKFNAWSI